MGYNICGGIITGSFLKFYTDIIGLEPIWFGIAFFVYGIWNAINDPFIGYLSDRAEPREGKGKRLPYIKFSLPIMLVSMFLMIFVNPTSSQLTIFIILLIGLLIFDVGGTMFIINYNAITVAITNDPNERASISTFTSLIFQINGAVVGAFPFLFLTGDYSLEFIVLLFALLVILGMFILAFTSMKIEEPIELYGNSEHLPVVSAIKEVFKSKAFLCIIIVAFTMMGIGSAFGATILYYLNDLSLGLIIVLIR